MFKLMALAIYCQTVVVEGTLRDHEGNPLIGANIKIKGTAKGTVANIDGNYSLEAPVGSILVVSYIGYQPMEFEVTEKGNAKLVKKMANARNTPENKNIYPQTKVYYGAEPDTTGLNHDPKNGVAIMSNQLKYKITGNSTSLEYLKYKGIRRYNKSEFLVFKGHKEQRYYEPKIVFSSTCLINKVNSLPQLQHTYAQGCPVNGELKWMGPESESLFAWGPALSQLEFDGSKYPYDKNGSLVPLFMGKGKDANTYNPYSFFQNGMQFRNNIRIEHLIRKTKYYIAFRNNHQKDIIPLSQFGRNTLEAGFKTDFSKLTLEGNLTLSDVKSKHSGGRSIRYHILKSVLLTPPTFDNSNALGNEAANNSEAYYTYLESPRSAAINLTDNPYWLINNSQDQLNARMALGSIKASYKLNDQVSLNIVTHADNQSKKQRAGINSGSFLFPEGRFYKQTNNISSYGSDISVDKLEYKSGDFRFTGRMHYQFNKEHAGLDSEHHASYPILIDEESTPYNYDNTRTTNRVNTKLQLKYRDIVLLSAQGQEVFFSDIGDHKGFIGASISGGVILSEIYGFRGNLNFMDHLKLYGSFGNDFKAPPLFSDAVQYSSVALSADELNNFFPTREIVYDQTLLPENIRTLNIGMDLVVFWNRLGLTINWYNKNTTDAILPDYGTDQEIRLKNLGDLRSRGFEFTLNANFHSRGWRFMNELNLTTGQTLVTSLYNGLESIPLAGFGFVSSNATIGEPLGVLVGTAFQRDLAGEILIDGSGYPLVGSEKKVLGNPAPTWTAGLLNNISYRNLDFSVIWEMKHGGKIWNGTKASLDYYGLSASTAEQRDVRNYVFAGNTADGNPNTKSVDFANPNNSLETNRWVRYGVAGVAEEYIEDAGWLRIRDLSASYSLRNINFWSFREIKIGLHINNIVLVQKYSGVDPESALFGQPGGRSLDYFNMPSSKSYGISLEIRL